MSVVNDTVQYRIAEGGIGNDVTPLRDGDILYDLHLDAGLPPATALKQAQAWLREAAQTELINYSKAAAAKAKIHGKQFASLESKLASRLRSPDTHFDEIANALQDKTSLPASAGRKVEVDDQTLQTRPFAHPYYWGGFIYTGL